MSRRDEFYIGWQSHAPAGIGRRVRLVVAGLLLLVAAVAVILVTRQGTFSAGVFEYGVEREFTGLVLERPYPALVSATSGETLLLSALGKRGAGGLVLGMHAQPARVRGSLIYRDGRAMIEAHEVEPVEELSVSPHAGIDRGEVVLTGEIVDSKCFLGVMKPGHTKPHRGCAVRCISGGVPPLLLVVDSEGVSRELLLAGPGGEPVNAAVLPYVAELVEVHGSLRSLGDLDVLYADPVAIRRVR